MDELEATRSLISADEAQDGAGLLFPPTMLKSARSAETTSLRIEVVWWWFMVERVDPSGSFATLFVQAGTDLASRSRRELASSSAPAASPGARSLLNLAAPTIDGLNDSIPTNRPERDL